MINSFKPETCPECGKQMIETSDEFLSCPDMHGKLRPKPKDYREQMRFYKRRKWWESLPKAIMCDEKHGRKKLFSIKGKSGSYVLDGRGYACLLETEGVARLNGKPRKFVLATTEINHD